MIPLWESAIKLTAACVSPAVDWVGPVAKVRPVAKLGPVAMVGPGHREALSWTRCNCCSSCFFFHRKERCCFVENLKPFCTRLKISD